jgi:hypothetical protein
MQAMALLLLGILAHAKRDMKSKHDLGAEKLAQLTIAKALLVEKAGRVLTWLWKVVRRGCTDATGLMVPIS